MNQDNATTFFNTMTRGTKQPLWQHELPVLKEDFRQNAPVVRDETDNADDPAPATYDDDDFGDDLSANPVNDDVLNDEDDSDRPQRDEARQNLEKFFRIFQEQNALERHKFTDSFLDNLRNSGFYENSMMGLIEDTQRIQNQRTMPKIWQKFKTPRPCIITNLCHRIEERRPTEEMLLSKTS